MKVQLLYFAWVRERIGLPGETVETYAATVTELIEELSARDDRYAAAFADLSAIKVAVNQDLSTFDADVIDGSEIAFFPPMTGG